MCKVKYFNERFITSAKEVMFLPDFVCLSVCLCVSKITQKVMDRSSWNFESMSGKAQTTSDSILGVVRKESWILDHFEIFVTIAFNRALKKPLQNRRWCCHIANNIALAEACGLWLLSSPTCDHILSLKTWHAQKPLMNATHRLCVLGQILYHCKWLPLEYVQMHIY